MLKHFTNHEKKLSNCLMIILKLCLRLNIDQFIENNESFVTLKQMLQRLPIALAQVKASENILNEIKRIIYFLYLAKEIT